MDANLPKSANFQLEDITWSECYYWAKGTAKHHITRP